MNFDLQDLSGTFSTFDIIVSLSLAFVLSAVIGWVYRYTTRTFPTVSPTCRRSSWWA